MNISDEALDVHLEEALEAADDETARYHIREALQLLVVEEEYPEEGVSA